MIVCLKGAREVPLTNPNEFLHNVIWRFCPKLNFVGRATLEAAICMALCQSSKGATFRETLCNFLKISPGQYLCQGSLKKSIERIKKAKKAAGKDSKQKRKQLKYSRSKKDKVVKSKEGESYKPGSFT